MEIIFIAYKKVFNNEYFGKIIGEKENKYIKGLNNIKLNTKYILFGEYLDEERTNFEVSEYYEYIETIGTIKSLKSSKNGRSIAIVETEDGKNLKAEVNTIYTEVDTKNVFKGYFKKSILITTFAKRLETRKVIIKENLDEARTKYKISIKAQIFDDDISSKEKIYLYGNFSLLYKEDVVEVYGYKDGKKFIVLSYNRDKYSDTKMIRSYISHTLKGVVSQSTITQFINKYGVDSLSKLEDKDSIHNDFPKMKEDICETISRRMFASKYVQDFFYFCEKKGIAVDVANYIFNKYGAASLDKLRENPYLVAETKPSLFQDAEVFAKELNWEANNENRVIAAIKYLLDSDMSSNGNMFMYKDDLLNEINPFLVERGLYNDFVEKDDILNALKILESNEVLKIEDDRVYFTFNYVYEKESARKLKLLIDDFKIPFCTEKDIDEGVDAFEKSYVKLDKKQILAIKKAILSNISILTGGPGTGKTLTVNAILKTILRIKNDAKVKLCAPTGRAAKRMMEFTNYSSSTIHKLLKLNPYETISKDDNIPESMQDLDFLIIDEFSMVDAKLFYEMLICLDEKTRIIIIGDSNQLPSVGPGQVLKDLIDSSLISVVELTEIFRQAEESNIVKIAHKIIKNEKIDIREFSTKNIFDISKSDISFVETSTSLRTIETTRDVLNELIRSGESLNDIQILSSMNKNDVGANNINSIIQEQFNKALSNKDRYEVKGNFFINKGDRVIQTVNNYDPKIDVMNGSIGYVKDIFYLEDDISKKLKDDDIVIEFDGEDKHFTPDDLMDLKLAYNITIHKSQGSEFKTVIVLLDYSQKIMLNKNLIYTALTRAREKLIIIGSEKAFSYALNTLPKPRNSYLQHFFQKF